jgi:hypothetical protein
MAQETAQQKLVREVSEKTLTLAIETMMDKLKAPTDAFGTPLVEITCSAAELVPTVQFGNCTIGPVMIRRFVPDGDAEHMKRVIKETQSICDAAVADDRKTLHEQIRARNGN